MRKLILIARCKLGTSREDRLECWAGDRHIAIAGGILGIARGGRNDVASAPAGPAAWDAGGELWLRSDDVRQRASGSPEVASAIEEAQAFLDMDKTGLVIVGERRRWGKSRPERTGR